MRLTLRYTTPDMRCSDRRYECDGGITEIKTLDSFQVSSCAKLLTVNIRQYLGLQCMT